MCGIFRHKNITATALSYTKGKMYAILSGDIGIEYNWQWGNATGVVTIAYSSCYPDTCGLLYRTTNPVASAEGQTCFYHRRKVRSR